MLWSNDREIFGTIFKSVTHMGFKLNWVKLKKWMCVRGGLLQIQSHSKALEDIFHQEGTYQTGYYTPILCKAQPPCKACYHWGGLGACLPGKFYKLETLRLNLGVFQVKFQVQIPILNNNRYDC